MGPDAQEAIQAWVYRERRQVIYKIFINGLGIRRVSSEARNLDGAIAKLDMHPLAIWAE